MCRTQKSVAKPEELRSWNESMESQLSKRKRGTYPSSRQGLTRVRLRNWSIRLASQLDLWLSAMQLLCRNRDQGFTWRALVFDGRPCRPSIHLALP